MPTSGSAVIRSSAVDIAPETIKGFLRSSVAALIDCAPETVDTDVSFGALGLDSMTSVSLLGLVELEYCVDISPEDVPTAGSCIDDVVLLVSGLLAERHRFGEDTSDPS